MASSLNPSAPTYTYSGSMIFMGPSDGVCFNFQFGKCHQPSHHSTESGDLFLHICQACFQVRHHLVTHSCKGGHNGHSSTLVGAIGCPNGMSQAPPPPYQPQVPVPPTGHNQTIPDPHPSNQRKPDFACDCLVCAQYFKDLDHEISLLNTVGDLNIFGEYCCYHNLCVACYSNRRDTGDNVCSSCAAKPGVKKYDNYDDYEEYGYTTSDEDNSTLYDDDNDGYMCDTTFCYDKNHDYLGYKRQSYSSDSSMNSSFSSW